MSNLKDQFYKFMNESTRGKTNGVNRLDLHEKTFEGGYNLAKDKVEIAVDHLRQIEKHLLNNDLHRAKNLIKYALDRIERVQK